MADVGKARAGDGERAPLRWWGLVAGALVLVLGAVVGLQVVQAPLGDCDLHMTTQFAGSDSRLDKRLDDRLCDDVSDGDVDTSLLLDSAFAVAYALVLHGALRRTWGGWCVGKLTALKDVVPWLPVGAAVCDVLENVATRVAVDAAPGAPPTFPHSDFWPLTITTLAWWKWALLAVTLIALVTSGWASLARRSSKLRRPDDPHDGGPGRAHTEPPPVVLPRGDGEMDPELGICCSGGGVRAAAYTLGVLHKLDTLTPDPDDDRSILARSRWLAAVSGGAYTAGAYAVGRMSEPELTIDALEAHLTGPPGRHRFLLNDPGGAGRAALWMLGCIAFNVVVICVAVFVLAWPIGWVLSTWPFEGDVLRTVENKDVTDVLAVSAREWLPGAVPLGVAAGLFLLSALLPRGHVAVGRFAARLTAVGLALLAVLVVLPIALQLPWLVLDGRAGTTGATLPAVGAVSAATLAGVVWRMAKKPLAKAAPRLGGVVLGVLLALFGGWIVTNVITDRGPSVLRSVEVWAVAAALLTLAYALLPIGWTSPRYMYRTRLRGSFSLESVASPEGTTGVTFRATQSTWKEAQAALAERGGPELLLCAAAQRIGLAASGIPAETLTISPTSVCFGSPRREIDDHWAIIPTQDYLEAVHRWSRPGERSISSWQATTGAAFSSAMGRFGYGTTNALLAALNIDLGGWYPNPVRVADGYGRFPYVRLGYLVKEVFGIYDEADDHVFVADGGQWENLGLVELLRRRCQVIVCIDAGGDQPGRFTTLRQAVSLAVTELAGRAKIDLDFLDTMTGTADQKAPTTVGSAPIRYRRGDDHSEGLLIYAKAQVAADLSIDLSGYANTDPTFPSYSTANQFLRDEQFKRLVQLGHESGDRIGEWISWLHDPGHQEAASDTAG